MRCQLTLPVCQWQKLRLLQVDPASSGSLCRMRKANIYTKLRATRDLPMPMLCRINPSNPLEQRVLCELVSELYPYANKHVTLFVGSNI